MDVKKAISQAVSGNENYHEIMRSIAVYSLQKQASYNQPQGDLSDFEALPHFNVKQSWYSSLVWFSGKRLTKVIVTELKSSEPICEDCARLLENMINANVAAKTIRIEETRGSETCYFCARKCDDIPF